MPAIGYITARAYASYAEIPLEDVAIRITAEDGTLLAMRMTDSSGRMSPVALSVPDRSESQQPENDAEEPFASVNLYATKRDYEEIIIEGLQVFAGTTTTQDLEMTPLSEFPNNFDQSMLVETPPQDL